MDTLQAAILMEILELFPDEVARRQEKGEGYNTGLANVNWIETPLSRRLQYFSFRSIHNP